VLVPDIPGAQTFRLHGPPAETAAAAGRAVALRMPSTSLVEHSFDDLRRRAAEGGRR
jgi:hypothetical protein